MDDHGLWVCSLKLIWTTWAWWSSTTSTLIEAVRCGPVLAMRLSPLARKMQGFIQGRMS